MGIDTYSLVKTLHILSATVLFGTGLGIAFFFWMGGRAEDDRAALFAAEATVIADWLFTTSAVIAQPLTGAWLVWRGGFDPAAPWLVTAYALYLLAGACWLPVVRIQLRIRDQLRDKVTDRGFNAAAHSRLRRIWFLLGRPAFLALIVIFHLMVSKPTW